MGLCAGGGGGGGGRARLGFVLGLWGWGRLGLGLVGGTPNPSGIVGLKRPLGVKHLITYLRGQEANWKWLRAHSVM